MSDADYNDDSFDLSEEEKALEEICKSIERSRKRNLSDDLLRGDQAADRLRTQEASASPLLKKSRTMAITMADFEAYMDRNVKRRLESIDEGQAGIRDDISKIEGAVSANSEKIAGNVTAIAKNEAGIKELRDEVKKLKDSPATPRWPSAPGGRAEEAYDIARRSVRLWPVAGQDRTSLWTSTGDFLRDKLDLEGSLRDSMFESIERVTAPSGPGAKDEVLVRLKEPQHRDLIVGAASKLAPYVDETGRPTAGIRMEVPKELLPDFRTLYRYGQNLRARHGPGTRKHIKFSDMDRSIFLNVKLPGDESWSRVSVEIARRGLKKRSEATDEQLEARLDIDGPPQGEPRRPRAASLNDSTAPGLFARVERRTESLSS